MKPLLILNPNAGSADESKDLVQSADDAGVEVVTSQEEGHAREIAAREVVRRDLILCAGGDGTLHEVVNGLWKGSSGSIRPVVGIIPLGTGNDFARTLCLPEDPVEALELALQGSSVEIDLIEVRYADEALIAVNVCAGGFSGALNEHMTPELKKTWGPLAYLLGAAATIPELEDYHVEFAFDDGDFERADAFNVVVANGRTAGGGAPAAPRADPSDGMLDVVVVCRAAAPALAALAAKMLAADYLDDDLVLYRRAKSLRVRATPGMWFNADGELLTKEPISFRVLPGVLRMIVGSEFHAR